MSLAGQLLVLLGALMLVIAALGLWTLKDALARQHAATKGGTLALGLLLLGAGLLIDEPAWWWRIAIILVLLFCTLPVASHMLARAAARHAYSADELAAAKQLDPALNDSGVAGRSPD